MSHFAVGEAVYLTGQGCFLEAPFFMFEMFPFIDKTCLVAMVGRIMVP